jgi:transposase
MSKKVYNAEFRRSAIALVTEQSYTPEQAAHSLGVHPGTLKYWLRRYRVSGKVIDPVQEADLRKRNAELERENARLRMERDILKKAAAFFAREAS